MLSQCRVLVACTTMWPLSARLASAFIRNGCEVFAIGPADGPLDKVSKIRHVHAYRPLSPLRSLSAAIAAVEPDLIVPCDDLVVAHLHALHDGRATKPNVVATIRRSLGAPSGYPVTAARGKLMRLAETEGLRIPVTQDVTSPNDLSQFADRASFPWVLKSDGSWSGSGVQIVYTLRDAEAAFLRLTRPIATAAMLKELFVARNPFCIIPWVRGTKPAVIVQRFIPGRPANIMFAAWEGQFLAATSVEVLETPDALGSAAVVRLIDHPEMSKAAHRLASALGLSGFYGLDFILEDGTDAAWLIEMNPRSTQLGHLRLGPRHNLPGALATAATGLSVANEPPLITTETIAFFPHVWSRDPASPYLWSAFHDVPWEEPELLREMLRPDRTQREILGRARARLFKRSASKGKLLVYDAKSKDGEIATSWFKRLKS